MKTYPTIVHALAEAKGRPHDKAAVKFKANGSWQTKNWRDTVAEIEQLANALKKQGVDRETRVGILSETRYEWMLADMAVLSLGAQTVPIYPNLLGKEVLDILRDSGIEYLFIDSQKNFSRVKKELGKVKVKVISIDFEDDSVTPLNQLLSSVGKKSKFVTIEEMASTISANDIATIVYTSGSMGDAKGVILAHEQIMSEVLESFLEMGITQDDTTLTFLPYAHIFGRLEMWGSICYGNTLAFAESPDTLKKNFLEVRPTVFIAVPRVFEKIYVTLLNQINTHQLQKIIFKNAQDFGVKLTEARLQRKPLPFFSYFQFELYDRLVFSRIRELFGGRLRFSVSGGAPLSADINRFFWSCGIPILEGYGLSETTGAVTVNRPFENLIGSVGKPIGDVELKLAEDNEILIKSKKVMRGYLNKPKETADTFVNGYFKTGDFGEITPHGFLKITGRKKELIKTSGGKYIAPQRIEQKITKNPLIEHAVVIGDQRKYAIALITIARESSKGMSETDIRQETRKWIAEINNDLASFETIKNFEILNQSFSVDGGELTPSLKVKRKAIEQKYKDQINALY